ncbi:unnamed protein product [Phytophthora lilii]|uniref:Unnamed protein product n=1 Tax=Phytophthora lilii TaxID=2077276 RepID=A0A9W6TXB3_9STRA|nr:unnamed protein product [Phytophthora lilii]
MYHCVLYPPNINRLGVGVIGDVMQRARPVYALIGAEVESEDSGSLSRFSQMLSKPNSNDQSNPVSRNMLNSPAVKSASAEDEVELRRLRSRTIMARYRKKQINRAAALEEDIRLLNEELQSLELQRRLIDAGISTKNTICNVAARYFWLFRNGYRVPVLVSQQPTLPITPNESDTQRNFLQDVVSPNVVDGAAVGVDALLEHWRRLSFYLPEMDMQPVRLSTIGENSLLATTKVQVTLTAHTLRHAFPSLTRHGWSALAGKLLNLWSTGQCSSNGTTARIASSFVQAEKEGHLASDKFLQAAQRVSDRRTIDALVLLAENYEYRAKAARARNPRPESVEQEEKQVEVELRAETKADAEQEQVEAESPDPSQGRKAETQLNLAAAEMEELWRRLNEIGLSSPGSADKVGVANLRFAGRLMEQQLGGRMAGDPRRGGAPTNGSGSIPYRDPQSSGTNGGEVAGGQGDYEGLQETIAHQKMEIVRLLNTVKTLSSENTKLVKV